MTIELNHLIVPVLDPQKSAKFVAEILGLEVGPEWAHFVPVRTTNAVTLDFAGAREIIPQHYAFLLSDVEFDAALVRLRGAGAAFHAEFDGSGPGEINQLYGGRGVYFADPSGHLFELITRPYAPIPERWIDGRAVQWTKGR